MIFAFYISFLTAVGAKAEELTLKAEKLTLKDFVANTLQDNFDLLESRKAVLKAEGQKLEVWGRFFPKISATYNYMYTNRENEISFSMPVAANGGITYEEISISMGQNDTYKADLSLRQPVFTFGTIRNSYKISRDALEIQKRRYSQLRNSIVSKVRKAYHSVLLMTEIVDIAGKQKSLMEENLRITKNLYKNGKASNLDVSRVKVHLAKAESGLIEAETNLQLAREILFSISQIKENGQEIAGKLEYREFEYALDELVDMALKNRQEIHMAGLTVDINKRTKWINYARNLPKVYAFAGYTYERSYLSEDTWENYWSAGGTVEFPFFDGLSFYGRDKKNKATLDESKIQKERIKETVRLQVKTSYYVMQQARKKIKVQKENLFRAEENLKVSKKRYALGLLSNLELNQAILDYTSSGMELLSSIFKFLTSLEDLKVATGKEID